MSESGFGKRVFGAAPDGTRASLYPLSNRRGTEATLTDFGATLVSLRVGDRRGQFADVVLGYDSAEEYAAGTSYFGGTIGRYANRIARGRFMLGAEEYRLACNNGANHLHGGARGFNKVAWAAHEVADGSDSGVRFGYASPDGEEGYPGNLEVSVTYTLTEEDELRIEYAATTDRQTIVNLTHHSYFNLAGSGDVLRHELTIDADRFTPVDETLIPTGEFREVSRTPMDFTSPTTIGSRIGDADEQLRFGGGGYDHNWALNDERGSTPTLAARVYEPTSGRVMEVLTTEPGLQFYSGNQLDGSITGKGGERYERYRGFCLEAQRFPDSPNKPHFPPAVLDQGETYTQTTIYKFSVE